MISVVTLVNDVKAYTRNIVNTLNKDSIQLLPIFFPETATKGLNQGIKQAQFNLIVICHQDILFPDGWLDKVHQQIDGLKDDNFGVLGTYGINYSGTDGAGNIIGGTTKLKRGVLPCPVMSLDEHCLIIRKDSGLLFDESLIYFHMYGADLCLTAYKKGMKCYAIDAFLYHLQGTEGQLKDQKYREWRELSFCMALDWFREKWKGKTQFKKYRTTCCFSGGIHGLIDLS